MVDWTFSSCAAQARVLEDDNFFGKEGKRTQLLVAFGPDFAGATSIKMFSKYPNEEEVV